MHRCSKGGKRYLVDKCGQGNQPKLFYLYGGELYPTFEQPERGFFFLSANYQVMLILIMTDKPILSSLVQKV